MNLKNNSNLQHLSVTSRQYNILNNFQKSIAKEEKWLQVGPCLSMHPLPTPTSDLNVRIWHQHYLPSVHRVNKAKMWLVGGGQ